MANRPMTLQEKLAAIRAGGPAKPSADEPVSQSEREVGVPGQDPAELADLSSAPPPMEDLPPTPPPPVAAGPTPSELGRPLTLKEKLAAARAGGAASPAAAPPPAAPAPVAAAAPVEVPVAPAAPVVPAPSGPTPSELGRPLTMKEKLAAARGAAPAAGAPAAAKPAAAKVAAPTTAKPAAAARALPPLEQTTDPKDLAEHLRRAGAEKEKAAKVAVGADKVSAKAPPKKAESKVVAPRPSRPGAAPAAAGPSRRALLVGAAYGFLTSWVFWGWASFTAASVAFLSACARFMFPNVLAEPPSTIKVGLPTNFEENEVNERWKAEWGFWIVRNEGKIYALQSVCTHLGCPPNWLAGEQKFKCPCHGSGFYISGINFEGPAPRPLERFKLAVGDDGQMVVDKSQKYQFELGQWSDPDSFIQV